MSYQQVFRYGLVGLVNTAITGLVIVVLTMFGIVPLIANAAGFACGLLNSFIMNGKLTFQSRLRGAVSPFILAFAVSYAVNVLAVALVSALTDLHVLFAQAAGILSYNIVFFVLLRSWVFADEN